MKIFKKKRKEINDRNFSTADKPDDWPANAIECQLENIESQLEIFKKDPNYKNKEVLVSLFSSYDLNQSSMAGVIRTTPYEVACINALFLDAYFLQLNSLKTYLYELVGHKTRMQKIVSWFPEVNQSLYIDAFEEGLFPQLQLYYFAYQKFTVENKGSFSNQLIALVQESIEFSKKNTSEEMFKENVARISNMYISLLNDISNFRCAKRTRIWAFERSEILELFQYAASLIKINGDSPIVRPLKGVLMMSISNYIMKSRNNYNEDYLYKYINSEVVSKSIKNHQIWMSITEKLNDCREQKVVPELFEKNSWNTFSWAKDLDFIPKRKYYVSSFCKAKNDEKMMKDYGECIYGYKDDRIAELLAPIMSRNFTNNLDLPVFTQVITFDVLYNIEEAKEEIKFLCSIIDCFDMDDVDKKIFLEDIMQYWILSVKDSKWAHEQERRYILFMYDDYNYNEIDMSDSNFLKIKTSLFIEPDFILGPNPVKSYLRAQIDNKRNAISTKPYLFCSNCLNRDFDIIANDKQVDTCPICDSKKVLIEYPVNKKNKKHS